MRHTLLKIITALMIPVAAVGQSGPAANAVGLEIRGTVVDAASSAPLRGATIVLAARDAALVLPSRNGTPQLESSRKTTTAADGSYEFHDLATGQYQLRVRRIGYEPETIDVDLTDASAVSRVSIGLIVAPIQLRPLRVSAVVSDAFGSLSDPSIPDSGRRASVATARQQEFLSSDVRELTSADANDGGSLGEADILRAFRHVPGVTGPDDTTDELFIRGGQWDQVHVYYDGLPVLDPRHAGGMLSAVGSDAIGAAFLHPGVRSASNAAQGASLIELRSRAARNDSSFNGALGMSLEEGVASFDKRTADGALGVTISGRRSFDDVAYLHPILKNESPAHYSELAGRADIRTGASSTLEISGLWTQDFQTGFANIRTNTASGTTLGKATFRTQSGQWSLAQSFGVSHFGANLLSAYFLQVDSLPTGYTVGARAQQSSSVTTWMLSGEARTPIGAGDAWSLGYDVIGERASYAVPVFALNPADTSSALVSKSGALPTVSGWTERRWQPRQALTIETGLRAIVAMSSDVERVRFAPTLQTSYRVGTNTRVTAGASRSFQDIQHVLASSGTNLWTIAGRGTPLLVADQAGLGVERWHNESYLFALNGYVRSLRGILLERTPANEIEANLPATDRLTDASLKAYGAELSARKLSGNITGSISYSLGRATERWDGFTSRAPGERRSTFDATAMRHVGHVRIGASYVTMSGTPYLATRVDASGKSLILADTSSSPLNTPRFASVGLFADWTGHIGRTAITPYLSMQNVTGRKNPIASYASCSVVTTESNCLNGAMFGGSTVLSAASTGFRIVF